MPKTARPVDVEARNVVPTAVAVEVDKSEPGTIRVDAVEAATVRAGTDPRDVDIGGVVAEGLVE